MGSRYRSDEGQDLVRTWCLRRLDDWGREHTRLLEHTSSGEAHLVVAGDGPATVLLLPGTNFGAATSLPLVTSLERDVRVVVADLPGQPGLSDGNLPDGDRSAAYGVWAGDIVGRLHDSDVVTGPLVVVGHSLGAAVALSAPPAGVDGLVLVDPAGLMRLRVPTAVLRSTLPWILRPTPDRSRALLRHLTAPGREPPEELVDWMTLVARHSRPVGAPGPLPSPVLARWRGTPTLVLSGEHDCFLPPDRLTRAVRGGLGTDLVVLPGTGHLSVDDDPDLIADAITDFATSLARHP
jgi:pimeloyl-ACP methyl ester carboxylesterase